MGKKGEEVYYRYLMDVPDENGKDTGELSDIASESVREGYFELWSQMDSFIPPNFIMKMVVGIVRDKTTGKVHLCKANHITFKNTAPP